MSLVPSLLQAIVRVDGDALVMHAGDKPYVVSPTGQVDLASRGLTLEAVNGIVSQLLPIELQNALDEFGAVQHELAPMAEFPGEHFTIVAARGGDDVWAEIRRRRIPEDDRVPDEFFTPSPVHAVSQAAGPQAAPAPPLDAAASTVVDDHDELPVEMLGFDSPAVPAPAPRVAEAAELERPDEVVELDDDLRLPDAGHLWPGETARPAPVTEIVAASTQDEGEEIEIDLDADEGLEAAETESAREAARVAAAEEVQREAARLAAAEEAQREAARVAAAEEAQREAARLAAAEAARREAARLAAAEEAQREAARVAAAEEAQREAARVAAAEEARREAARLAAAEEAQREAARLAAAEEAQREAARLAAAAEAQREAARLAAAAEAQREAARLAATEEAQREAARLAAAAEAQREAARLAAAAEAQREAARLAAAAEAQREAARLAAAEEAQREAARLAAAEEAQREAARLAAAEEAQREAARLAAAEEAQREAARLAAAEEAQREAARLAAVEEAQREAARLAAAEEAQREAARLAAAEEAQREAARLAAAEEAQREAARLAAAEEAQREAARLAAAEEAQREAARLAAAEEAQREAARLAAATSRKIPAVAASAEAPQHVPGIAAFVGASHEAPSAAAPVESPTPAPSVAPAAPIRVPSMAAMLGEPPRAAPPQPAVVLNISRNPIRSETPPPPVEDPTLSGLERLLRVSSARGASTLYLSSESRPSVRVDGELQLLDGEPVHAARDVESLLLTLMPERSHEALRTGAATEWICDLEGVGRVRCMSFRDQRGPGGVFRLMPTRSVSADQLGLPKQVQALAIEPEGLVLIAGSRSSGKRTTMSAFVDLMNRTRRDHIITIEREINIQHERGLSFISQREVRGGDEAVLAAARAAMREDPDVLVIEELRTGALVNVALEAAAAGRLVIAGFTAPTATGAIDRIIDLYAPEYHRQVQMALADSMRGVIAQALLRKIGGGRLPAREVLLNTPAVSSAIAEGKTSQLPMAIEGGRRYGMMPLNDALVGLVQSGSVDAREAYRHSPDRPGFLAALNRNGIDTSFVDRLANG